MKTRASVLVAALWAATVYQCCAGIVALAPSDAYVRQIAPAASEHQAQETFRMPMLLKRKQEKEDPANPVAAAATDPNEAAMKIKSRDLVPTDRPGVRPEIHHHRHTDESKDEEHHNADSEEPEDEHDSDEHRSSPPHKASKSKDTKEDTKPKKPKSNDKNNNKDKDKDKDKDKGKEKGKSKNSKTHTGLDGKEVDDEDSDEMEARRKKIQVQHIQAKRRKWRTGRPKYDYKQAIAGWKEVGPMYYYKGKYENDASRLSSSVLAIALLGMI